MSPVAIPRHFTENYIDNPDRQVLISAISDSFGRLCSANDVVVVEGTGHAGVGSVFDMSNGDVASLLGCKAVIVSSGGIGRPIDEIMLNKAMFDASGVEILGVIVNKVEEEKYDKVKDYVIRGLARKGLDVLGVMPYRPSLSHPTVGQLLDDIEGEVLAGEEGLNHPVSRMVIGAMPPHQALQYMVEGCLMITPGTRDDLILAALSSCVLLPKVRPCVAGLILTGGTSPQPAVMDMVKQTSMPVILVQDDTFSVASKIAKLIVKIRPGDTEKIRLTEEMVEEYVDVDKIMEGIAEG